jgi:predicted nucleic acid-binding protein
MKKCASVVVAFPMNRPRTAIDANVLIAAWSAQSALFERALAILEDPERTLIVSDALWLEVMPKAIYHARAEECAFYQAVFARGEYIAWSPEIVDIAKRLAESYGLAAMDATHLAVALAAGASEFISGEKPSKPMFRVKEIAARSLWGIVP